MELHCRAIIYEYLELTRSWDELASVESTDPIDDEPSSFIEQSIIREIRLDQIIQKNQEGTTKLVRAITDNLIFHNSRVSENRDDYEETDELRSIIELFRSKCASSHKESWRNIEIVLGILRKKNTNQDNSSSKVKRGPGRPKNEIQTSNNQGTLDQFFPKRR